MHSSHEEDRLASALADLHELNKTVEWGRYEYHAPYYVQEDQRRARARVRDAMRDLMKEIADEDQVPAPVELEPVPDRSWSFDHC